MTKLEQANNKSLAEFLHKNGHVSTSKGNKTCFFSPFHDEKVASFYIDSRGKWKDYSVDPSAMWRSNVDFVELYKGVSKSDAIKILLNEELSIHVESTPDPRPYFKIVEENEIISNTVIKYILSRKVDVDLTRKYCKQLHVCYPRSAKPDKPYKMIGFPTNAGGWEVRMKYPWMDIKCTLIPDGISSLKGTGDELIFEGFFNFLSYVTIFGDTTRPVYVLNSTGNWGYVPVLMNAEYWGDNGWHYNKIFRKWVSPGGELLGNLKGRVRDMRFKYRPHGDLNDWLISPYKYKRRLMND